MPTHKKSHWGGHLGATALLAMLLFTSCVAYSEQTANGGLAWLPAWTQSQAPRPGDTVPVTGPQTTPPAPSPKAPTDLPATVEQVRQAEARFIVRFEDEPLLSNVGKTFRRDERSARASYRLWQQQNPKMTGIELLRASYSGELILVLPSDDPQNRTADDVLNALQTMDTLVYAEPDSSAKPSQ